MSIAVNTVHTKYVAENITSCAMDKGVIFLAFDSIQIIVSYWKHHFHIQVRQPHCKSNPISLVVVDVVFHQPHSLPPHHPVSCSAKIKKLHQKNKNIANNQTNIFNIFFIFILIWLKLHNIIINLLIFCKKKMTFFSHLIL